MALGLMPKLTYGSFASVLALSGRSLAAQSRQFDIESSAGVLTDPEAGSAEHGLRSAARIITEDPESQALLDSALPDVDDPDPGFFFFGPFPRRPSFRDDLPSLTVVAYVGFLMLVVISILLTIVL
ncbi:MAG: hypothetical protein M1837_003174 [Sclerophora amabilis]|nr:MAG: hypothetical protein M1837_003174 [Sclerophora amabilis]